MSEGLIGRFLGAYTGGILGGNNLDAQTQLPQLSGDGDINFMQAGGPADSGNLGQWAQYIQQQRKARQQGGNGQGFKPFAENKPGETGVDFGQMGNNAINAFSQYAQQQSPAIKAASALYNYFAG